MTLDLTDIIESKKLKKPESLNEEMNFNWESEFLKEIMGLMLTDSVFFTTAYSVIKKEYFKDKYLRLFCDRLYFLYEKYNTLPVKTQLYQSLLDNDKNLTPEDKLRIKTELNLIYTNFIPGINTRDYYRDKVVAFAKSAELRLAFRKSLDLLTKDRDNDETWDRIQIYLQDALAIQPDFEIGLDYFTTVEERYDRMQKSIEDGEVFTSAFEKIDKMLQGGGLRRGQLCSIMGMSGTGKSLWLTSLAVANLNIGKKVLYISLELDSDSVAQRFDAQLANPDGDLNKVGLMEPINHRDQVIYDLGKYIENFDDQKRLIVKQFPGGTFGIAELRAYYQQVKLQGFDPDLVVVDYIGEMKDLPGMKTHESRYRIVRDMRGFAVEEDICMATAMQSNRSAKEVISNGGVIDDENLADAYDQIRPLDAFWTINQTVNEKKANVARVYVSKHRFGRDKEQIYIQYDPYTLKLSQIEFSEYDRRKKSIDEDETKTVAEFQSQQMFKTADQSLKNLSNNLSGMGGEPKEISFSNEPEIVEEEDIDENTPKLS